MAFMNTFVVSARVPCNAVVTTSVGNSGPTITKCGPAAPYLCCSGNQPPETPSPSPSPSPSPPPPPVALPSPPPPTGNGQSENVRIIVQPPLTAGGATVTVAVAQSVLCPYLVSVSG